MSAGLVVQIKVESLPERERGGGRGRGRERGAKTSQKKAIEDLVDDFLIKCRKYSQRSQ